MEDFNNGKLEESMNKLLFSENSVAQEDIDEFMEILMNSNLLTPNFEN